MINLVFFTDREYKQFKIFTTDSVSKPRKNNVLLIINDVVVCACVCVCVCVRVRKYTQRVL